MSEDIEPSGSETGYIRPLSHERVLRIMAVIGIAGAIAGFAFGSLGFGLGILIGTVLAFVNYYWLTSSLRKIFAAAASGDPPRMLAVRYFLRYVVLAIVVAAIYVTGLVSIVALILGLGAFGFAVVIEGLIRIFHKGAQA